ncbi:MULTISPECIES: hypothetical protein [Curtobacterium]|jgi:hypothetical protein|uniref:Uncharacterized protein n=2 Tax=Curtobacterium TaxID=2034 RepID=A0A5P8YVG7_9MICO|nr:hypothetical protein [Curtobacterium flaccumfaciens]MBO9041453.1 hypothetical protein [Curtobacterium flaccumfaciens pv. flaccumfaciens]MBO9044939.1 hypothetical protein [Curtobacterium flaccumfaciens pv. flaccumfaciens]MBO9048918.1 hypothetical protein [Curtobacterium flaccumfaciens pv. flaccumfaciens]MBO9057769.1 hypothetical protein [Curtobacterium flaccumfaciens pv. flaccumfaciens]MBT1543208.1 hypothetical protein [Curtobacterium flaccumfaciens pv. flaccumfaciens]
MSKPRKRRKAILNPVRSSWLIEQDSKDRVTSIAERVGVADSAFVDEMISHLELDSRGVPVWWPYPVSVDDGELPIDEA